MKRLIFSLIIIIGYFLQPTIYAQGALTISTKDLNGNTTTISDVATGEFIVLDFWATWCKPCVKSIPKLIELSEKYSKDKVSFVGINEDSPRNINKVKPFVKTLGITYPIILDPEQEIMSELMVNSYPTLIVVDRESQILFVHEGYTTGDEVIIEQELNELINKHE